MPDQMSIEKPESDKSLDDRSVNTPENSHADQNKQPVAKKLDPTRYGDWEKNGRCIDF